MQTFLNGKIALIFYIIFFNAFLYYRFLVLMGAMANT